MQIVVFGKEEIMWFNYDYDWWTSLSNDEKLRISIGRDILWTYVNILAFIYDINERSRPRLIGIRRLTNDNIRYCFNNENIKYVTEDMINEVFIEAVKYVNKNYSLNLDSESIKTKYCDFNLLKNKESIRQLLLDCTDDQKVRKEIYVAFRK